MDKKILVVDDDLAIRDLLYDALTKEGYQVKTVANGTEAIEAVRQQSPDLILLDFKMAGKDGLETLKGIKDVSAKIKIIILTGMSDEALEKEARLLGASGFLRKSLGINIIARAVNEALGAAREHRENKILVIDDDPQIRSLIQDFLVKKGFDVITAASGEEGLQKYKSEKPILILLDIKLPGMDGLLVLHHIREIDKDVGVIMITGEKDEELFEEAKKRGAYEYIVKPFDLEYLETCVLVRVAILSALVG